MGDNWDLHEERTTSEKEWMKLNILASLILFYLRHINKGKGILGSFSMWIRDLVWGMDQERYCDSNDRTTPKANW